jgi:DNA replication and repair protein RecF
VHLRLLTVDDFRSWEHVELPLRPGVTTLIGANGQGKTNLVEAAAYLSSLSSHRAAADGPLVRAGTVRAVVRALVVRDDRELRCEIEITPGRANRARLNGSPLPRARELLGALRTVVFAPEDLAVVKGDPGERRRFLDELLVVRSPRYAAVRSDYDRVLRQRTALLKSLAGAGRRSADPSQLRTLDVWDSHLAAAGASLVAGRIELVAALRPAVGTAYAALTGGDSAPAAIAYEADPPVAPGDTVDRDTLAEALLARLAEMRPKELERGVTLAGPHRDELSVTLGELPARGYASHGESWSLALALRLAAFELLRADGDDPVLILDDVFAELDGRRRAALAELVAPAEQVLITAAAVEDVPEHLRGDRVDVGDGAVRLAGATA